MKPFTSKLTSKGQTTIPAEIRKQLKLHDGDLIFYELESENVVRIRKLQKIDLQWTRSIESTLTEWIGTEDDSL